jgi:dipeptidyl aminopeptidase/acylaminoacyl peptidase
MNLTNTDEFYFDLQWSYDGKHLTVLKKVNDEMIIVRITQYGGGETMKPFTDPDNYGYSWSPTSYKVVFADASSGNYDIYTVYMDGRNDPEPRQLTNDPGQDVGFVWSPNGSQIAFERLDGEKLSVYIMNEDGSNQREIAHGLGKVKLRWSQDGKSIYASSTENSMLDCEACLTRPGIYQINLESQFVRQIYTEQTTRKVQAWYMYDTPQNMLYFMRMDPADFLEFWGTWMYTDGNSVRNIGEMDPHQTCKTTTGNILNEHISPNERFSIISNYCAGGFNLYLADREASNPAQKLTHILMLPLDTLGQGGDSATLPIRWSPDGRWLVYDDGRGSTYLLNVEKSIQEQDTKLSILIQPKLYTNPSGTYQSPDSISVVELTWQPKP